MDAPLNTSPSAARASRPLDTLPFALMLAAAVALSFRSGGYILGRSTPIVVACLLLGAVWVWFLRRPSRPSWTLLAALLALAAYALWSGLSVLWSFGPDLTWVAFNLTAFYTAVVAVLALTPVRALQLQTVAWGYLALATAVGVYAFLGKAMPDVVTHAHVFARLDSPVGYWNALAVMMVMGLLVALALAGDRAARPWLRTMAAAAAVPMAFTFFFTFSRGGFVVLVVGLLLYFAFTTTRLASLVTLAAVVVPVAATLVRLRGLGTLFVETTDDALRTAQGHLLLRWSLAALLVAIGLQLAAALIQRGVRWPRWLRVAAGVVVIVVLVTGVGGGTAMFLHAHGGTAWVKGRLHALLTDAESRGGNGSARLTDLSTNGRIPLWREAARQSRYDRVAGTGAGTFPFTHYRFREVGGVVKHAHSQWFNVLSELGVVGLALFVLAVVLLLVAMIGNPFAWRRDPLHPILVALQAGVIAFFVHSSADWDWDIAAIGTVVFIFIAASASYRMTRAADRGRNGARRDDGDPAAGVEIAAGPEGVDPTAGADGPGDPDGGAQAPAEGPGPGSGAPAADAGHASGRAGRFGRTGWAPRVVAGVALVVLALSWLPPYLADRAQNAALADVSDGDVAAGLTHVRQAARLDPLAVSPLLTEAMLLQQQGQSRQALAVLQNAAKLQPDNYLVWYQLGLLQFQTLGRKKEAKADFMRALALNPSDSATQYELQLLGQ